MANVIALYNEKFGHTLNLLNYPPDIMDGVRIEMQKAIDGKRGELTDKEFNQEIPDGADS